MEWLPIESAPKFKGLGPLTECIVYGPDIGVRAGKAGVGDSIGVVAKAYFISGDYQVTHWMPWPEPPK